MEDPVLRRKDLPRLADPVVLGPHPLAILGVDHAEPQVRVLAVLRGVTRQVLYLGAHVDRGVGAADLLEVGDRRHPLDERAISLLGLPKHLLRPAALGNVHHGAEHANGTTVGVAHQVGPVDHRRVGAVGVPETVLVGPHPRVAEQDGLEARHHPVPVLRVQVLLPPGGVGDLPRRVAEHRLDRAVPHLPVGEYVAVPERLVGRPGDQPVALLARPQGLLDLLAFGKVEENPLPVDGVASLVAHQHRLVPNPHRAPVPGDKPVLQREGIPDPVEAGVLGHHALPVVGVEHALPEVVVFQERFRGVTQEVLHLRADVGGHAGLA